MNPPDLLTTVADVETPLQAIGDEIRKLHSKANSKAREALEYAAECGRLLTQAKGRVEHGQWAWWIKQNTSMSHRTVSGYVRLAANWQRVANLKGSIRDTLKLLAMAESPPEAPESPPSPSPAPAPSAAPSAAPSPPPADPPSAKEFRLTSQVVIDAEIAEPEPVVVDGTKDDETAKRKPPIKVIESEGMRIWMLAKGHLDRINKHDEFRMQAMEAALEYIKNRIEKNI